MLQPLVEGVICEWAESKQHAVTLTGTLVFGKDVQDGEDIPCDWGIHHRLKPGERKEDIWMSIIL